MRITSQSIPQWTQPAGRRKLRLATENYITLRRKRHQCAQYRLYGGRDETASLMCGPLAASCGGMPGFCRSSPVLRMIFTITGWQTPKWMDLPWTFFPPQDYTLYHFDTPINKFDFFSFPLRPGDFFYTYAGKRWGTTICSWLPKWMRPGGHIPYPIHRWRITCLSLTGCCCMTPMTPRQAHFKTNG